MSFFAFLLSLIHCACCLIHWILVFKTTLYKFIVLGSLSLNPSTLWTQESKRCPYTRYKPFENWLTLKNPHAELAIPNFFSIIAHKRQLLLCPSPLPFGNDSAKDILFGLIGHPLSLSLKNPLFKIWRKIIFSICLITVWYSNVFFFFGFPFFICYLYSLYANFNAFNNHNGLGRFPSPIFLLMYLRPLLEMGQNSIFLFLSYFGLSFMSNKVFIQQKKKKKKGS